MNKNDLLEKLLGMLTEEEDIPVVEVSKEFPFEIIPNASICFTGTLEHYTRSNVHKMCDDFGLRVVNHPTKSTDYLVVGEKTVSPSKVDKATSNGTIILNEKHFEYLIDKLGKL